MGASVSSVGTCVLSVGTCVSSGGTCVCVHTGCWFRLFLPCHGFSGRWCQGLPTAHSEPGRPSACSQRLALGFVVFLCLVEPTPDAWSSASFMGPKSLRSGRLSPTRSPLAGAEGLWETTSKIETFGPGWVFLLCTTCNTYQ